MNGDRRVHASHADGRQIVRYDRAGKWYVENLPRFQRRCIGINEAVQRALAISLEGGTIHLGVQGGSAFDSKVRRTLTTTEVDR